MIVRIDYPQPGVRLDLWGGASGSFAGLDAFGRVTDQRWQNNTASTPADLDRYQYGYDRNSNRLYKANLVGTPAASGGLDELYAYDPLNRLTEMQRGVLNSAKTGLTGTPSRAMDWALDPTGNWSGYQTKTTGTTDLNQTRTSNTVNEIIGVSASAGPAWVTPAYDAAGNMTTVPEVADPTQVFTATYDAWNRMTGLNASGGTIATYRYDGRNRRVVKTTSSETRHYYWTDSWQDVEERVGTSTSMDVQHVWGVRYVDELVCRDDATSSPPRRLYALQDANFNVTAITDASGSVAERYRFDPYGLRAVLSASWSPLAASAYAWALGHQGLCHDLDNELIYNSFRYFHPQIATFLSRDPLEYEDSISLYEREKSNPILYADPFGLDVAVAAGATAAATGGTGALVTTGLIGGAAAVGYGAGTLIVKTTHVDQPIGDWIYRHFWPKLVPLPPLRPRPPVPPTPPVPPLPKTEPKTEPKPDPEDKDDPKRPRPKKGERVCRCTFRNCPDKDLNDKCPGQVYMVVPEDTDIGTCQKLAKRTAPEECRKYYGHCGWLKG